jgi:hypothetical protein
MAVETLTQPEEVEVPHDQAEIERLTLKYLPILVAARNIFEKSEAYKSEMRGRYEAAETNINALLDHWPNGVPREGVKPGTNKLKPLE